MQITSCCSPDPPNLLCSKCGVEAYERKQYP